MYNSRGERHSLDETIRFQAFAFSRVGAFLPRSVSRQVGLSRGEGKERGGGESDADQRDPTCGPEGHLRELRTRIALHRAHVLVDQAEACFCGHALHGLRKIYRFSQLVITSSIGSYDESRMSRIKPSCESASSDFRVSDTMQFADFGWYPQRFCFPNRRAWINSDERFDLDCRFTERSKIA